MKECSISLHRLAAPMLLSSVIDGGPLLLMQESIIGPSTPRDDEVKSVMKGGDPRSFNILSNRWLVGSEGEIYHYQALNPRTRTLTGLEVYEFTPRMEQFAR